MRALEVFHSLLNEEDEHSGGMVRDYFHENTIETIERHIDFFEFIPDEDKLLIFESFIQVVFYYQFEKHIQDDIKYFRKLDKIKNISTTDGGYFSKIYSILNENNPKKEIDLKPSQKIKKVIGTIKNYQTMIEETFASKKKNGEYGFINTSKEIYETYQNNKAILKDLENQEFKIVSRYNFYSLPNASKTPIKQFLQNVRKQYNLKTSLSEKQLIDELEIKSIFTNEV